MSNAFSKPSQSLNPVGRTVLQYGDEPWSFLDKHPNPLSGVVKRHGRLFGTTTSTTSIITVTAVILFVSVDYSCHCYCY